MSQTSVRRSEQAGIFRFAREMSSALIMALIFIVYVIQAFKIPTGSMEDSLLTGDFLLGLKFVYGAPVLPYSYKKFPGITSPKPGDVVIFKYPGSEKKDYIKRCVAGPGQTIEIHGQQLIVDGKTLVLPPRGKYLNNGQLDPRITNFKQLRIPAKGDIIRPADCELREFLFLKNLIHQENPHSVVRSDFQLYVDSAYFNNEPLFRIRHPFTGEERIRYFSELPLGSDDWTKTDNELTGVKNYLSEKNVDIKKLLFIDGKLVNEYRVKYDNYFMMGDNRDNSLDSRYWGYLNRNFVKAKAFILYFSLNSDVSYWLLPLKIRWDRIGKLILPWNGLPQGATKAAGAP